MFVFRKLSVLILITESFLNSLKTRVDFGSTICNIPNVFSCLFIQLRLGGKLKKIMKKGFFEIRLKIYLFCCGLGVGRLVLLMIGRIHYQCLLC